MGLATIAVVLGGFSTTLPWSRPQPLTVAPYPDYPRINNAACYEVDPKWPKRPGHVVWGPVTGVSVDNMDCVWICTSGRPPVQVYHPNGNYIRGWGEHYLKDPHQLRIDSEKNIWVVDGSMHVVRKFTRSGELMLTLGTVGSAGCDDNRFNTPTDVAVALSGDVFVSDGYRNSRVVHFDSSGGFVRAWGRLGVNPGEFSLPHSIVADRFGRLFVAERGNGRIQVFDQCGRYVDQWRSLIIPWGLAVSMNDEIWVCGSSPAAWQSHEVVLGTPPRDQLLMKFTMDGKAKLQWVIPRSQDGSESPGDLNWVHCIAEDSMGALYCGDVRGMRIQKFNCLTERP